MKRASISPRIVRRLLIALLLAFSYGMSAAPQNRADGAEAALLTVYVNGRRYPDREALVKGGDILLAASFFHEAISPLLEDSIARLAGNVAVSGGYLDTEDLRFIGFGVEWDEAALSLRIRVPSRFMALTYLGVSRSRTPPALPSVAPALFSAYVNSSSRMSGYFGGGHPPYAVVGESLDGALNLRSWVAEASFDAETSAIGGENPPSFATDLNYARLVRDFRSLPARLSIGTLSLPWKGLQSRLSAVGAAFASFEDARLPADVPLVDSRSFGDTFSVEKSARVSVKLNGASVYSARIEPGKYRFSDFPFASGLNEVTVEIEEADAAPVSYRVGVPFDSGALRRGGVEYGFGAGLDDEEFSQPAFSGFFSYGLTKFVNVGASFQGAYGVGLGALDASAATSWGLFSLQGAVSSDGSAEPGVGLDFRYRFSLAGSRFLPRFGLGGRWLSSSFAAPARERSSYAHGRWSASAQISQAIPVGLAFNLAGEYGNDGTADSGEFYFSFGLTAPFGRGTSAQATFSINDRSGTLERTLSISLIVIPGAGQGTAVFRRELLGGENSFDLSLTRGRGPGAWAFASGLENAVGPNGLPASFSASVRRTGRLADAYAAFGSVDEREGEGISSYFSLGIDSALAFAGGILAPTRKVGDSFALFAPDASFGDASVSMSVGADRAVVPPGGHARVAAPLSAYRDAVAEIDTPGSPPEISVAEPRVLLKPLYKSAVVVRPLPALSYFVAGRLVFHDGSPAEWTAGTVYSAERKAVGETFTDENGLFELYDVTEGAYTIEWASDRLSPTVFEIPRLARGRIDLGTIGNVKEPRDDASK